MANSVVEGAAASTLPDASAAAPESVADTVASPCVSICALDSDDLCVGCFRTGSEISYWGRLPAPWQREVLARTQRRMAGQPAPCAVAQVRAEGGL